MTQQTLEQPVIEYLHQLELAVKQKIGVVPEDVLAETRGVLLEVFSRMRDADPEIDGREIYQHFVVTIGTPLQVAQRHEAKSKPGLRTGSGNASHWRICCTVCGRSAPADRVGITRLAARSAHKYVMGWCHDCCRPRWMRLQRDLNQTNLSNALGMHRTDQQLREQSHRPNLVIAAIIAVVLAVQIVVLVCVFGWISSPFH